jgi:hypothetical protein
MTSTLPYKRFLLQFALLGVAAAASATALIVCIDPYGLYRLVDRPGLNRIKPQLKRYQKEIKTELALAARADAVIIGNSRAEIGFNPEHPAFAAQASSTFNLALAGRKLESARAQLDALRRHGIHPRKLVIGVDFLDFLVDPNAPRRAHAAPPAPDRLAELAWRFDTAFSIDSLTDALATVRLQRLADPESMTARGFNPFHDYRKMAREEGYYPLFQQRATDYAQRFVTRPHALRNGQGQSAADFEHLHAILSEAAAAGAEIHIAIYPYHAQILAMFEQAGMMPDFAQWKALMAEQAAAIRAAHPGARITLWDFSGYQPYQCEPIPARGDRRAVTAWYWEAGHFKAALGDIMLDRMFAQPAADAADGFGVRLPTPQAALAQRERLEAGRAQCAAAYPRLFDDAAVLVAQARAAR